MNQYREGKEQGVASLDNGNPQDMWTGSETVAEDLVEYIFANKPIFTLLINCSVGSSFEHFLDELDTEEEKQCVIMVLMGYVFMLPYFIGVALACELTMLGKDTYSNSIRNAIGWSIYGIGMMIGNAIPVWVAWESFMEKASVDGFSNELFTMEYTMFSSPLLMILACVITVVLPILGCVLGNRILRRHFKKAGVIK